MNTRIRKWRGNLMVRIPKRVAVRLRMKEGTVIDLSVRRGTLVVTPIAEKRYTLAELVAGITEENRHGEIDFGPPVGKELL